MTQWAALTKYELEDGSIRSADAFRFDTSTGEFERAHLAEDDRVEFDCIGDVPERYDFVTVAEDYREPAKVWAIFATPSYEWAVLLLDDDAGPGELTRTDYPGETDDTQ